MCKLCLCFHRSGIWQTLNVKVLLTSRYKCTAGSHHNGFVCFMCIKCIWSQDLCHMLYLRSPQQFFVALRLVACAQNGLEVALKSLNVAVPPPKFVSLSVSNSAGSVHVLNAALSTVFASWQQIKFCSNTLLFHCHSNLTYYFIHILLYIVIILKET